MQQGSYCEEWASLRHDTLACKPVVTLAHAYGCYHGGINRMALLLLGAAVAVSIPLIADADSITLSSERQANRLCNLKKIPWLLVG